MNPRQLDDRELFARVAQGASDAETWSEFVSRFSKLCYHAIYRVLARYPESTPSDADELFQRLFEHLLADDRRVLRRYRGENGCSPKTYLSHQAAYQTLEAMRRRDREKRGQVHSEDEEDALRRVASDGPSPEEALERSRDVLRIQQALEKLGPNDRLLYELHYVRGLSLADVSQMLSKTETAVHIQHFRLKERLRKVLVAEQEAFS